MSNYLFNKNKLTVAQLLVELGQGDNIAKLEPLLTRIVPIHYTTALEHTGKAYFYQGLAFMDFVSQEDKVRDFNSSEFLLVASRHNSPLTYSAPDGAWFPASIGYQG